jgi:hypothetical protein
MAKYGYTNTAESGDIITENSTLTVTFYMPKEADSEPATGETVIG